MDRADRTGHRIATAARVVSIPALLALGALASRALLAHAPARWSTDLIQPLPVATSWGAYGAWFVAILIATLATALLPYASGIRAAPSRATILVACALSLAAGFLWLPLLSSDVYAYAAYGELARLGIDPYVHLLRPSGDAIVAAAQWQWGGAFPACVYGGAFVELARAVTAITGPAHVLAALTSMRLLAAGSLLACAALAYAIAPRAAWFLALNPVAIWAAIEGHNDLLALAVVLAGVIIVRKHPALGYAVIAAAAAIKLSALASTIALFAEGLLRRRSVVPLVTGTVAGLAVAAVASAGIVASIGRGTAAHGTYLPLASVQSLGIVVAVLLALGVAWRARAFSERIDRWCILGFAAWIAIPNPYPWYAVWPVAAAAFAHDRRVRVTAIALSMAALLRYLPDAAGIPTGIDSIVLGLAAIAAFVPLVL